MPARTNKKSISTKSKKAVSEVRANYRVPVKRAVTPRQNLILKKCKQALKGYYGERLKRVILYGSKAQITIETISILNGTLPPRVFGLVAEWALAHQNELRDDWQLVQNEAMPNKIDPLE
jgi:Domain of unknown function (DUF4160)